MSLVVRGLTVSVAGEEILHDVGLDMDYGEILAVLGPSGSGKTTLLRALAGLQPIESGTILWDARSVVDRPPHLRGFGLMFQDYALFPHLDVGGNVAFGLRMQGRAPAAISDRVDQVLELVGLTGFRARTVASLSGGEQQRVALARALAPEPVLLMLDEPVGSLDRTLRERLVEELRELLVGIGISTIYVTHDQEEAFGLADRVVLLNQGRVVQTGSPQEIWAQPADEWVARFLGQTNLITASVASGVAHTTWGSFPVDGLEDGIHRLVVRPEGLSLTSRGGLPGQIADRRFEGGRWVLTVNLGTGPALSMEVGFSPQTDEVGVAIDPQGVTSLRRGEE